MQGEARAVGPAWPVSYFGIWASCTLWLACREEWGLRCKVKSVYSARYRTLIGRLRRARTDAGLTQAQVAAELGRPQSFISKCESGERRIDPVELELLARLYGKPLPFFLPEEEEA